MRHVIIPLLSLFLCFSQASAGISSERSQRMMKDSIACWERQDFSALARGELRQNYWLSHQQKRDYMAEGRCFAVRKGERVQIERLDKSPYALMAKARRVGQQRSFWTDHNLGRQ